MPPKSDRERHLTLHGSIEKDRRETAKTTQKDEDGPSPKSAEGALNGNVLREKQLDVSCLILRSKHSSGAAKTALQRTPLEGVSWAETHKSYASRKNV